MERVLYGGCGVDVYFGEWVVIIDFGFGGGWRGLVIVFVLGEEDEVGEVVVLEFFVGLGLEGYVLGEQVLFGGGEPAFPVVPDILPTICVYGVMISFLFDLVCLLAAITCAIF